MRKSIETFLMLSELPPRAVDLILKPVRIRCFNGLFMGFCPSVGWSVCPLVPPSAHWSLRLSIGPPIHCCVRPPVCIAFLCCIAGRKEYNAWEIDAIMLSMETDGAGDQPC